MDTPALSKNQVKKMKNILRGTKKVMRDYKKNCLNVNSGWVDISHLFGLVIHFDEETISKASSLEEMNEFEVNNDKTLIRLASGELNEVNYQAPEQIGLFSSRNQDIPLPVPVSNLQPVERKQIPVQEETKMEYKADMPMNTSDSKVSGKSLPKEEQPGSYSDVQSKSFKTSENDGERRSNEGDGARRKNKKSRWSKGDEFSGFDRGRESRQGPENTYKRDTYESPKYGYGQKKPRDTVQLSKLLSNVLRHKAMDWGLDVRRGGYVYIDELLSLHQFKHKYYLEDIEACVDSNDKKRFVLHKNEENSKLEIKACQGHTMKIEHDLQKITDPAEIPVVIHGTYMENWQSIRMGGLHSSGRQHIHFAPGVIGEKGVVSGMRWTCNVVIILDTEKAMKDGIEFFMSENKVILSPGDKDGFIKPRYFQRVYRYETGRDLEFDKTA